MATKKPELIGIIAEKIKNTMLSYRYSKSDWTMRAYFIPRVELENNFLDKELLEYNSIYFLLGSRNSVQVVYVGQGKVRNDGSAVLSRLREHNDSKTESYRKDWHYAIVITSEKGDWGPTELNILENRFYHEIPAENRLNGNEPNKGGEDNSKDYEEKVRQAKAFLSVLGLKVFDVDEETAKQIPTIEYIIPEVAKDMHHKMARIPEIITPQSVVKAMVDMLPKGLFNPYTKFFDPACKGGEYLAEIQDRLMESPFLIEEFSDEGDRRKYILENQLYGIALSQESFDRASRNLCENGEELKNIKVIKYHTDILKNINKQPNKQELFKKLIEKEFGAMQFDVVIGNPPYQEATQSIYQHFIDLGIAISKRHVCMIVKNNWLNSNTLKSTRDNMTRAGLKGIINYPVIGEVFRGVTPAVTIFDIDKAFKGETHYKEIRDKQVVSEYVADLHNTPVIFSSEIDRNIYAKVEIDLKNKNFGELTYPTECFRITTNGMVGRGASQYVLNDFAEKSEEHSVAVIYMDENKRPYYRYISRDDIPARAELAEQYKVVCGRIISNDSSVVRNINIAGKGSVCTSSWGILYAGEDLQIAKNVASYTMTKFFRYLTKLLSEDGVIAISPYRFSAVPIQDFSKPWTDQELYVKYGLTAEEIEYIEKTIKAMPNANQSTESGKPKLDIQAYEAAAMNMALKNS